MLIIISCRLAQVKSCVSFLYRSMFRTLMAVVFFFLFKNVTNMSSSQQTVYKCSFVRTDQEKYM